MVSLPARLHFKVGLYFLYTGSRTDTASHAPKSFSIAGELTASAEVA